MTPQGPQAPPPPPPIDLKFYGFEGPKNGSKRIFLLKGEDIFLAKEGDIVDRRYKIMHIGPNSVEVQDVLTNNTQTIPLTRDSRLARREVRVEVQYAAEL